MISPLLGLISDFTLYLLFTGLGIFGWLAWRSHSVKSFQFQISMFLLVWIVGEFVSTLHEVGLFNFPHEFHDRPDGAALQHPVAHLEPPGRRQDLRRPGRL